MSIIWCYRWAPYVMIWQWWAVQCISREDKIYLLIKLYNLHDIIIVVIKIKSLLPDFLKDNIPVELSDSGKKLTVLVKIKEEYTNSLVYRKLSMQYNVTTIYGFILGVFNWCDTFSHKLWRRFWWKFWCIWHYLDLKNGKYDFIRSELKDK